MEFQEGILNRPRDVARLVGIAQRDVDHAAQRLRVAQERVHRRIRVLVVLQARQVCLADSGALADLGQ